MTIQELMLATFKHALGVAVETSQPVVRLHGGSAILDCTNGFQMTFTSPWLIQTQLRGLEMVTDFS